MSVSQAAQRRTGLPNIGHWTLPKIWVLFLYRANIPLPGNDFELILTLKMETKHPVERSFGREFPAICNHCVVMASWSHKTLKFCWKFLRFVLQKRPLMLKFPNSVPKVFTVSPSDVVVFKCRKIWPTGNRWNIELFTWQKNKFRLPLKLPLLRPKSARASPQQCTQSASDFIQIGLLSVEL